MIMAAVGTVVDERSVARRVTETKPPSYPLTPVNRNTTEIDAAVGQPRGMLEVA